MKAPERIAATSYLNTIPFIYGIENAYSKCSELLLSSPRLCAEAFINHKADIALVPVSVLPNLTDAKIITPYCIGAEGEVRSVVLLSNQPVEQITTIYLDQDSLTSVRLIKVLCKELWQINPTFKPIEKIELTAKNQALVIIGDKVFEHEGKFAYSYDLSQAWNKLTNLPFVFAVWVARSGISQEQITKLSEALEYGVQNIAKSISHYKHTDKNYAEEYLTQNINYIFDNDKREALKLFWEKSSEDNPPSR